MNPNLPRLLGTVARLRNREPVLLHTSDIITADEGRFVSNRATQVCRYRNAAIGRMLSRHAKWLGIVLIRRRVPVADSDGHRTHAALWCINPQWVGT